MGGGGTSWLVGLCEERGRWGLLTAERESFSLPYSLRYVELCLISAHAWFISCVWFQHPYFISRYPDIPNFMGGGGTSWLVGLCEERGRWGLLTAERESFSLPYSLRYGLLNFAL